MQTRVKTPDRFAGNPARPDDRDNVIAVLGRTLTALLAALILLLITVRIFPPRQVFDGLATYLPIHTAMEIFAVVVSMLVFAVGWNTYNRNRAGNIVLLSCVFLAVGLLDIAHTLSFPGMPDFVTPSNPEKAIDFWLAARGLAALALLAAALRPWGPFASPVTRYWLLAGALGITALVCWLVLFHPHTLPATFIPGAGLTPFKIGTEYALIALYALAAAVFYFRLRARREDHLRRFFGASCVIVLSELFFTFFSDITDIYNQLGHVYKVIAYYLIYRAIFVHAVHLPYAELQQSQSDLWESEARFRVIFDQAGDGIGLLDNDGRYLQVNRKLCEILGYAEDELVGKTFQEITHPDDLAESVNQRERLKAGAIDALSFEKRYLRKDGSIIWAHISSAVVRGPAGELRYSISSLNDISDRKRAQQRQEMEHGVTRILAESETIAEAMPKIIQSICNTLEWDCGAHWQADAEQQRLHCVETWGIPDAAIRDFVAASSQRTFAIDYSGLIRRAWASDQLVWIPDVTAAPTFQRALQAAEAGLHGAFAFQILTADKVTGVLEFFSRNIRQPDHDLLEITRSIGAQIGQFIRRRQAEHAQQQSEAQLSGIIQSAMHAIITVDKDTNIVLFNPAAEKIFGYQRADMAGARLDRLIPARFRHTHGKYINAFGASTTAALKMSEWRIIKGLRANGEEFSAEASISQLTVNGKKLYTVILGDITERLAAEENLRLAAKVIENSPQGIVITDASNRIISVNPAFTSITGFTPEEVIGKSPAILHSGVQDEKFYQAMFAAIEETGCWQGEIWDRRRNGELYCEWLSINTLKNPHGEIAYRTVIFFDITKRKLAEDALRASEIETRLITDNVPVMIAHFDDNLCCRFANKRYAEFFGFSAEAAFAKPLREIVGEAGYPGIKGQFDKALAGHPVTYKRTHQFPTGESRHLEVKLVPDAVDGGKIRGIYALGSDITERRQAEEARARLAAIVESSNDAIIGRTLDGTITSWNAAAERMFGYSAAEAIGQPMAIILPPERQPAVAENSELLRRGQAVAPNEGRRRARDGRMIDSLASISPIKNEAGEITGAAVVIHDISERKRAEEQILALNAELEQRVVERTRRLEATNKELEAFSYSVSHDLRAPLRGIHGFSKVLLQKHAGHLDATGSDYLQRICSASVRMGELIDDLLQLSSLSRSAIRAEAVDLSRLANSILAELGEREPQRKVASEVQDGVEVSGDPRLLKIALENLLGNAWKFTAGKEDATIGFGSEEPDGERVISVKDNGAGFNMKFAHKLFGAFQRLHATTEFEGTGIGLATVQRIVNLHGGRIWADATPGKGATFYFSIPRTTRNETTTTQEGETA